MTSYAGTSDESDPASRPYRTIVRAIRKRCIDRAADTGSSGEKPFVMEVLAKSPRSRAISERHPDDVARRESPYRPRAQRLDPRNLESTHVVLERTAGSEIECRSS